MFLFDYRGYGRSQGRPSEEGLYQDALGAHDYLTRTRMIRPERIVLFGRSLGAAVAGELAVQKPAAGLILESSFPSIEAVAKFHYGGLPVHWLLGADFKLIDRLPQLSLPKLIIHGDQRRHYPARIGQAGLRGSQATQILLRHSRAPTTTTPTRSGARPISDDGPNSFRRSSDPRTALKRDGRDYGRGEGRDRVRTSGSRFSRAIPQIS